MKIRRLDIFGFKSFLNKTSLTFDNGISAIIGPNGCGKSNVVDAIRWVLGEQSPKQLRGSAMQDVIFGGNEKRSSFGLAEVTITLTNGNGTAPPPFEHLSEIAVSRRLYRSGESEYLINKKPCRLKDILYLFMDTGVGTQLYSIIDQGQIGSFIDAKPLDRRPLVEEVAGISKFNFKRDEAARKIEQTRQNLVRIDDILSEVKRQMMTLHRQAKKADRYIKLRQKLKNIEIFQASVEYERWLEVQSRQEKAITEHTEKESLLSSRISQLEMDHERLELENLSLEKVLEQKKAELYQLGKVVQEKNNRLKYLGETLDNTRRQQTEIGETLSRQEKREREISAQILSRKQDSESLTDKLRKKTAWLAEAERDFQEARQSLRVSLDDLEDSKMKLVDLISRESNYRNAVASSERALSALSIKRDRNKVNNEEIMAAQQKSRQERAAKVAERDQLEEEIKELIPRLSYLREQEQLIKERKSSLEKELQKLSDLHARQNAKFELLNKLQKQMEGLPSGTISLLQNGKRGIHGLLADQLETEPEFTKAVEIALGDKLQSLLVDDLDCALEAITELRTQNWGKSGFLLDMVPLPIEQPEQRDQLLMNKISAPESHLKVARQLLGSVYWAKDLKEAQHLWKNQNGGCTVVTLDGDIIERSGFIQGGSANGHSNSFFSRKEELRKLSADLETLCAGIDQERQAFKTASSELATLQSEKQQKEKNLAGKEFDHRLKMQEIEQMIRADEVHQKRLALFAQENVELEKETAEHNLEVANFKSQLEHIQSQKSLVEADIDAKSAEVKTLENELEASRTSLTEAKVEISSLKERITALSTETTRLQQEYEKIKDLQGKLRNRRQEILAQEEKTGGEIIAAKDALLTLGAEQGQMETLLSDNTRLYQEKRSLMANIYNEIRSLQKDLKEVTAGINSLTITRTEAQLNMEHLQKKINDMYQISLQDEYRSHLASFTPGMEAAEEIRLLKEDIDKIGEVNLTAIDEYREIEERHNFLFTQQSDLTSSLDGLEQAIRKINKTSRERMHGAIAAINEKLSAVLPVLFGGGMAALKLTDPDDPLGSGIELYVQPPGKKLTSLSLLSSGEKTMATLALLFAVYLVKPSPFCLLDEVDSPLDEANTERFNRVLKEISKDAQIILITHNQKIMEAADVLYGVTMEEKGVSKLLTVRLN